MKVIVFGGSGFLGSYVCDELALRGYKVIIADIKEPMSNKVQHIYEKCDIMDASSIERLIDGNTDYVYNFAGFADLNEAQEQPLLVMQLNVIGNLNILRRCKEYSVKRFVYASSAYAFSRNGSFYGISKYTSEKITEEFYQRYGQKFSIVRYGSLYGERADEHNYIYNLLKEAVLNNCIVIKNDEDDVREYIHAKDAAKLSVDILENSSYENETIILTGFERLRRRELYDMVKEILGGDVRYEYVEKEENSVTGHYKITPYSYHPSSARKLIANPFIDMGQGIVECIVAMRKELSEDRL